MSTDSSRLQAAIQRIAKQDPDLSALLGAAKNRGGQASSTGVGVSDAERDNLCCNGRTGSGVNAGADIRDPDDSEQEGLDPDDPASISDNLKGVTDCETGQPICFEGSDWIPPEGWESPIEPPFVEGYESGCYWYGPYVAGKFSSPSQYIAAVSAINGDDFFVLSSQIDGPCSGQYIWDWDSANTYNPRPNATLASCEPEEGGACDPDLAEVTEDAWPADDCVNLAIKGGKIVGSKYDPENEGSYSAPRDEIELCDGAGNRTLVRASPTGGWKSIRSLGGDIDPETGSGYLYRPNGQKIRQISPSEFRDNTV